MKPMYSHALVELSLELHIPPKSLYEQQFKLRHRDTPVLQLIWETYAENTRKLNKDVKKLRSMKGFGKAKEFYNGVQLRETFEHDFLPIDGYTELRPFMLVIILDLYFRLTPITMVSDTPEVKELATLLSLKPEKVAEIMGIFQLCDPYLNRMAFKVSELFASCHDVWQRFGNLNPNELAREATQMKDFFKTSWHRN